MQIVKYKKPTNKTAIKTFFLIFGFLFSNSIAFGCSYMKTPVSDTPIFFDGKWVSPVSILAPYVFIGEVVEIIKLPKSQSDENVGIANVEGLKIKAIENINLLKSASHYEAIPLTMLSDCSLHGVTNLKESFPIGSKVRVIAQEATIYKKLNREDTVIRLETSYKNDGSVIRNDLGQNIESSPNSIYNYKNFTREKPITPEEDRLFSLKFYLMEFELQKDLARLEKAKTESERLEVLERLVYYPEIFTLPYHTLARIHLKNSKKQKALEAKWEEQKQQIISQSNRASTKQR